MGIVKVNKRYKKQLCADSANCRIIKHIIVMNQIGYRCEINQIIRGYRRYVILNHEFEERKSNTIIIYARSLYRYIHTSFCANQISAQVLSVINDRKMLDARRFLFWICSSNLEIRDYGTIDMLAISIQIYCELIIVKQ